MIGFRVERSTGSGALRKFFGCTLESVCDHAWGAHLSIRSNKSSNGCLCEETRNFALNSTVEPTCSLPRSNVSGEVSSRTTAARLQNQSRRTSRAPPPRKVVSLLPAVLMVAVHIASSGSRQLSVREVRQSKVHRPSVSSPTLCHNAVTTGLIP